MTAFKNIKITKTARYYTTGNPSLNIRTVWFVLHGYGQRAEEFIKYFKPLQNDESLIIAPEGLNRFYLKGFNGKTGAAWMTREERENEIIDYINYLDSVYDEVIRYSLLNNVIINVIGFSQGAATACRWVSKKNSPINRLILWGGEIPEDVELPLLGKNLGSSGVEFVLGDKDEFISDDKLTGSTERLLKIQLNHKIYRFNGKHEIKAEVLRQLMLPEERS